MKALPIAAAGCALRRKKLRASVSMLWRWPSVPVMETMQRRMPIILARGIRGLFAYAQPKNWSMLGSSF
jgi:hypothetical protein